MSDHTDTPDPVEEPSTPSIPYDTVYDSVYNAVHDRWPYAELVTEVIYNAVFDSSMTILPPFSHCEVLDEDGWHKGINVCALRRDHNDHSYVMTQRGAWIELSEALTLVIGP